MTYDDDSVEGYLKESIRIAEYQYSLKEKIISVADIIYEKIQNGGKILTCGNGGSASDSQHLAAELMGRYKINREPLPALALTVDTSAITAIGNDYGYENVFSRQLKGIGVAGDILIAISTSGKSKNVASLLKICPNP